MSSSTNTQEHKVDNTFSVRLPKPLAHQVRTIATVESNAASAVIRRLLSVALKVERRHGGQ